MTAASEIPKVPYFVPGIGSGLKFSKNPDQFLNDCQKKFGDVFKIQLGSDEVTMLMNPLDYSPFFKHSKELNGGEITLEIAGSAFGIDIPLLEKEGFRESHEEISRKKMFGNNLDVLTEKMQLMIEKYLFTHFDENWHEGDLRELASTLIFAAGSNAFFGENTYTPELKKQFDIYDGNFYKLARRMPLFLMPRVKKARKILADTISTPQPDSSEIMNLRRAGVPEGYPEEQTKLLDFSFFWASQANTILIAFYTMQNILRDKQVKDLITNEVRDLFEKNETKTSYGSAKLDNKLITQFNNLTSCVYETLRLTTAPMTMRQCYDDLEIELEDGRLLSIKAGEYIAIYPRLTHLNEKIYENPEKFKWDRFLNKMGPNQFDFNGKPLKHNLLPFGGGANMCPGRHFALNEFIITVAEMLYWFDFELIDTHEPDLDISRSVGGAIPPQKTDKVRVKYRFRNPARL